MQHCRTVADYLTLAGKTQIHTWGLGVGGRAWGCAIAVHPQGNPGGETRYSLQPNQSEPLSQGLGVNTWTQGLPIGKDLRSKLSGEENILVPEHEKWKNFSMHHAPLTPLAQLLGNDLSPEASPKSGSLSKTAVLKPTLIFSSNLTWPEDICHRTKKCF